MQERVTAVEHELFDIVVQFGPDLNTLGIGLEPRAGQRHFVDSVYGGDNNQIKIGKIFCDRMKALNLEHTIPDFKTELEEARWLSEMGRAILDSVTGSTPADGLWTWLSRGGTNRLIRLLRNGRDKSFGRDE